MNIGKVMERHGVTTKDLAEKLGTSAGYVSQLTSGKTAASIKKLDELAELIGCKRWEFFLDEMNREDVAEIMGLIVPQEDNGEPAAPAESDAGQEPTAEIEKDLAANGTAQGALMCPHCGRPFVVEVKGL